MESTTPPTADHATPPTTHHPNVLTHTPVGDISFEIGPRAIAIVISLIAILIASFFYFRRKSRSNVLLVGLSDAGKTLIFTKFVSKSNDWELYKSMKENVIEIKSASGDSLKLIDYPGTERLRNRLLEFWLGKEIGHLRRLMFVIDSDTFTKKARDIAELLYDVLIAMQNASKVPIMVICNKQDLDTAKSSKAIRGLLEKELGLVSKTRNSTLESTSDTQTKTILTNDGEFKWEKHGPTVEFVDATATDVESISNLKSWAL
ncbi:Signal recognition particle receptor subunit beta [Aphelenchoides besseyi]|nr:Signal recognition particle receptor subunit beta [Aphelenchoides besseyi]KAI6199993.1 Signal recognition particle receptor subunit beta [Aphelenchoides besseyi]